MKRLQRAVVQRKDELGSGRAVCREHGINDRDYTWLMKHFARCKAGQPTISEAKLRELAARFLPADAGAGADG